MGENTELRRSVTHDNKIMYKFNDKSLARWQTKTKPMKPLGYTCMLCSVTKTLSVIAPIFHKLVFVKHPDRMSR